MTCLRLKKCPVDITNRNSETCQACNLITQLEYFLSCPSSVFRKILKDKPMKMTYFYDGKYTIDTVLTEKEKSDLKKAILRSDAFQTFQSLRIEKFFLEIDTNGEFELEIKLFLPSEFAAPGYRFICPK